MSTRKRCPNKHDVSPMHEFCGQCGEKLVDIPYPDCLKCGEPIWSGLTFCPFCGELYPLEMRQQEPATIESLVIKRLSP